MDIALRNFIYVTDYSKKKKSFLQGQIIKISFDQITCYLDVISNLHSFKEVNGFVKILSIFFKIHELDLVSLTVQCPELHYPIRLLFIGRSTFVRNRTCSAVI